MKYRPPLGLSWSSDRPLVRLRSTRLVAGREWTGVHLPRDALVQASLHPASAPAPPGKAAGSLLSLGPGGGLCSSSHHEEGEQRIDAELEVAARLGSCPPARFAAMITRSGRSFASPLSSSIRRRLLSLTSFPAASAGYFHGPRAPHSPARCAKPSSIQRAPR